MGVIQERCQPKTNARLHFHLTISISSAAQPYVRLVPAACANHRGSTFPRLVSRKFPLAHPTRS